ncbi:MAG: PA2779 family protein [Acidobacteria bacterium]|nr:PA2779 family protein [Acidobacteriota bacterium]
MKSTTRSSFCVLLSVCLAAPLVTPAPVAAELISTSEALALERGEPARSTVDAYFLRQDVARQLAALGVDPESARLRAAALSPAELEALAGRIEEAPAGGSLLGILGATFIVLLILEWVGVIDIFKKI